MKKPQLLAIIAALFTPLVFTSGAYAEGYDCEYRCFGSGTKTCEFKVRKIGNRYRGKIIDTTYEHIDSNEFLLLYEPNVRDTGASVGVRIINKRTLAFVISSTYITAHAIHKHHKGDGGHVSGRCVKND